MNDCNESKAFLKYHGLDSGFLGWFDVGASSLVLMERNASSQATSHVSPKHLKTMEVNWEALKKGEVDLGVRSYRQRTRKKRAS